MICALSTAPDHPHLTVTKTKGTQCKIRKTFLISGLSPDVNFRTYNNTIDAAECAIKERVLFVQQPDKSFAPPPQPLVTSYTTDMSDIFAVFKQNVKFSTPMQPLQFAMTYQARKRTIYINAAKSLELVPLTQKDAVIKAFLKFEKYNFKPGKRVVPRVISPRGPRFTVSLGRYVKPIEKQIYHIVNTKLFDTPTILKGLNPEQRGGVIHDKWLSFRRPCAIGIDAKRFDQHVSIDALRFEHEVYKSFHPYDKHFHWLLSLQLRNKCFVNMADGSASYRTTGTRMSGDVNTALGNCLISTSILWNLRKVSGINFQVINDGDDCVLFCETRDEPLLRQLIAPFFLNHGFNMEIEATVFELEQVVFCQSQPIFDGSVYTMVRDPRIAIAKDCVSLKPLDNIQISKMYMAAIADCGLSLTSGIPVFQSFYDSLKRGSDGAKPLRDPIFENKYWYTTLGLVRTSRVITDESRYSFWLAFDISPDEQIAIEQLYDSTELSPYINDDRVAHIELPM